MGPISTVKMGALQAKFSMSGFLNEWMPGRKVFASYTFVFLF
jgi:hypothetical protein